MFFLVKTFFQKLFQVAYKLEEISIFKRLNVIFIVIDVQYKRKRLVSLDNSSTSSLNNLHESG